MLSSSLNKLQQCLLTLLRLCLCSVFAGSETRRDSEAGGDRGGRGEAHRDGREVSGRGRGAVRRVPQRERQQLDPGRQDVGQQTKKNEPENSLLNIFYACLKSRGGDAKEDGEVERDQKDQHTDHDTEERHCQDGGHAQRVPALQEVSRPGHAAGPQRGAPGRAGQEGPEGAAGKG